MFVVGSKRNKSRFLELRSTSDLDRNRMTSCIIECHEQKSDIVDEDHENSVQLTNRK